jgi:centromere/kinetochore protein ZW10
VSRENGAEISSWISQARKLHRDIKASKASADDILQLAKEERELEQELEDAGTQSRFLSSEIRFNSSLGEILSKLQLIRLTLSQVEHLSDNGELCHAIEIMGNAEVILEEMTGSGETIVISLMMEKAKRLKSALVNKAEDCWRDLVTISPQENEISIRRDATGKRTWLSFRHETDTEQNVQVTPERPSSTR